MKWVAVWLGFAGAFALTLDGSGGMMLAVGCFLIAMLEVANVLDRRR